MHTGGDNASDDVAATGEPPRVFRLRPDYLVVGIVGALFFATMGIASVRYALGDVHGSYAFRVLQVALFVSVWGAALLLGLCLIAAYFREELELRKHAMTYQGVIRKRMIHFHDVSSVNWLGRMTNGVIVIRTPSTRCKIHLENFTPTERRTIVNFLRSAVPTDVHEGWEEFLEQTTRASQPPPQSALTAVVCMVMFLAMSVAFVASWHHGVGTLSLLAGAGCAIATPWYAWRIWKFIKERPVQTSEQAT